MAGAASCAPTDNDETYSKYVGVGDPGRNHRFLPALATNPPPADLLNASRLDDPKTFRSVPTPDNTAPGGRIISAPTGCGNVRPRRRGGYQPPVNSRMIWTPGKTAPAGRRGRRPLQSTAGRSAGNGGRSKPRPYGRRQDVSACMRSSASARRKGRPGKGLPC